MRVWSRSKTSNFVLCLGWFMKRISVLLASLCSFKKIESAPGRTEDCCLSGSGSGHPGPIHSSNVCDEEDVDGMRGENAEEIT